MNVKKTFFQVLFPDVLAALNSQMGIQASGTVIPAVAKDFTKDLNVKVLCVACVYLMHNLSRDPRLPNIVNLQGVNLNAYQGDFSLIPSLLPYAICLQQNCIDNTMINVSTRKKVKTTTSDQKLVEDHTYTLIRYLFILQQKKVYLQQAAALEYTM